MEAKRLLVIEDDENIAALICLVAREAGFNARMAGDEKKIRHAMESFKPHIVVLDIMMPEMDGFEVLKYLSTMKSHAGIVIISGQNSYSDMAERQGSGFGLNVITKISKPFRVAELRRIFQEIYFNLNHSTGEEDAA